MDAAPVFPPPPSYSFAVSEKKRNWLPLFKRNDTPASRVHSPAIGGNEVPTVSEFRRQTSWRISPNSGFWTLVDEWWLWELLSWCFAAACMGAIAIFLAVYEGRPLPEWPLGLTINSYVSILSAFAKAALLLPTAEALGQLKWNWFTGRSRDVNDFQTFDEASRGPWGSFMLILRTRGRALAAIGAAIMVLSVALDPFFQQIVVFPLRMVPTKQATVRRSLVYHGTQAVDDSTTTVGGEEFNWVDAAMDYYVNPLLFSNKTADGPEIDFQCPTANCTFPEFQTLGVCSSCTDVSDLLTFDCLNIPLDWTSNNSRIDNQFWTNGTSRISKSAHPTRETCGYFLNATSTSPMLMSGYESSTHVSEVLLGHVLPISQPFLNSSCYYDGSVHFKDIPVPLTDLIIVSTPGGYEGVKANVTPIAQECNVRWCVKTLESSVTDGRYAESVLETYDNRTEPFNPWIVDTSYDGTPNWEYHAWPAIQPPGSNTTFGLDTNDTAFQNLVTFMLTTTQALTTAENSSVVPLARFPGDNGPEAYLIRLPSNPWLASTNWSAHIERIAEVMTDVVRSQTNGTELVDGIAWGPQTYVHIRWVWFSLPLVLLFFSLAFLVAAILEARSGNVDVWKNSALAVLMHGLRDDIGENGNSQTRGGVRDQRLKVRLRGRGGRWRFSKQHFSQ